MIDGNIDILAGSWCRPPLILPDYRSGAATSIVAVATTNRYDVATFDKNLANKIESFGFTPYF